jgi:hypothetical protein
MAAGGGFNFSGHRRVQCELSNPDLGPVSTRAQFWAGSHKRSEGGFFFHERSEVYATFRSTNFETFAKTGWTMKYCNDFSAGAELFYKSCLNLYV